jgi:hypothetical protein
MSFASYAFSSKWYKLDSEFDFPEVTEIELENLIWTRIDEIDDSGAFPRSQYSYQYSMKDAHTVYILGFCKLSDFFDGADLTKKGIGISDGGACYFNAWYSIKKNELVLRFNGVA